MKVGVVGLGFMGSTHVQAWQKIAGVQLGGVVSSDEKKLSGDFTGIEGNLSEPVGRLDFGSAERYRTPDQLLSDPRIHAVDLCVPTDLHRPLTEKALGAGKHVLVEKPMSLSTDDCSAMIHAANNCGKVLMVGHVLRFWPEYVEVKEMVASGAVGSVISASFGRRCAAPRWAKWMGEPSRSGGGSFDLLIHDFDYCLCLFGRPKAVRAMGAEDLRRGIDYLDANVFFETGPVVSISGGWLAGEYPFSMEFTIIGSRGTLHFHSGGRPLTLFRSAGEAEEVPLPAQDGFEAELSAFAEACRAGRASVVCPPTESAAAVEVALAALESRRKNGAMIHV